MVDEPASDRRTKTAVVVMGVAGSGKTTVVDLLAEQLGWQKAEADDFHPPANVQKMRSGTPLTDEDRRPWLTALRDWISAADGSVLVTCSALRRRYRDVLRQADADVKFLHLNGDRELIKERITARQNHFMPASLLDSQLAALEPLQDGEPGIVVGIEKPPPEIVDEAVRRLGLGVDHGA